jgi:hypothetical protein
MARRDELLDLLRPPAHRGPLIAAGAVVYTVGIVLEELRLEHQLALWLHLVITAVSAALVYGIAVQAEPEGGGPAAYQSVLLVCGLALTELALLNLGDVFTSGDGELGSGTIAWTSLLLCGAALYPAVRRNSAICTMIAAVAAGVCILATADKLFDFGSQAPFRWILLALALIMVLASLVLRGGNPRHAELLVITAGLAILAIVVIGAAGVLLGAFSGFGGDGESVLPGFWELIVLGAGCGLIAYGAVDRVPGAAWLGVANLVGFIIAANAAAEETLLWWPLILLALGGGAMAVGLRPRQPLPPEPAGYSVERPLASRSEEEAGEAHADGERAARDTTVVRVRNDEPPSR